MGGRLRVLLPGRLAFTDGYMSHAAEKRPIRRSAVPSGSSALPANFCPVSGCGEFARFSEDFGEPVREPVEAVACIAIWKGAAEHFEHMLRSAQGIDYPAETSAKRCK